VINPDINCFLGTLLYPITDPELVINDFFDGFFEGLPCGLIEPGGATALKGHKKRVLGAAVRYIAKCCSIDSYDQVFQYMERWYLGQAAWRKKGGTVGSRPSAYERVFHRMKQLSRSMISKLDGQIIYKYWETEGDVDLLGGFAGNDKLHLFRSLNQMLPLDILVAIFVMENPDAKPALDSFYGHISITDAPLERILRKGVAENHLHMGVATCFSIIWEDIVRPNIPLERLQKKLPVRSPAAPPEPVLYFYFLAVRCLRMYLAIEVLHSGNDVKASAGNIQAIYQKNLKLILSISVDTSHARILAVKRRLPFDPGNTFLS